MRAWLRVVPRPHIGSNTDNRPPIPSSRASAVTLSSSLVKCSLVLPAYFWIVIRSLLSRSRGLMASGLSNSPSIPKTA